MRNMKKAFRGIVFGLVLAVLAGCGGETPGEGPGEKQAAVKAAPGPGEIRDILLRFHA